MVVSYKAQTLLIEIKKKGSVSYKTQETFNNGRSFKRVIRKLLHSRLITSFFRSRYEYELTLRGNVFVSGILEYDSF